MAWLEGVKADSDGIVLVFHEQVKEVNMTFSTNFFHAKPYFIFGNLAHMQK